MRFTSTLLCIFVLATAGLLFGQAGGTGTILGTVTDSSGAVVPNASVDVTNTATKVVTHTQTTSSGDFTAPFLIVGNYEVAVTAPGFQKSVVQNITLNVAQEARANVALKAGAVTDTVEVTAGAIQLDVDTSAIAQTVTQKQVEQLPLNGRNFLSLLFITPGAVTTGGEQSTFRQGSGNAISINGGRPESNNYMLDGLVNTDPALNTPAVILSQDAIQEFKILSENYSAEYGYSANQVALVSKSGSNDLHGTGFEFFRNDDLDANTPTPFSNSTAQAPELRQNQFGFVLGGPVYIPHVYDGRNKTFWLANYEGWRIINGTTYSGVVPTAAELGGNFSGAGLNPFNLTTGSPCQAGLTNTSFVRPCMPGDPNTGAEFTGDIIPTSRFSRIAQSEIAQGAFGAPTAICVANPNNCGGGANNFQQTFGLPTVTNQQTYRIDQELGKAGKVFFRYTWAHFANSTTGGGYISPIWSLNTFDQTNKSWTISHTIALGARNVNNFRFGHLSPVANQGSPGLTPSQVNSLGLTGVFTTLPTFAAGIPGITFAGSSNDSGNFPTSNTGTPVNTPTTSSTPTWEFADSMTMIRGKHTIGVGVDYRHFVEARNLATNLLGTYGYSNNLVLNNSNCVNSTGTTVPCTTNGSPTPGAVQTCTTASGFCGTGNAVADFLLGYYNSAANFTPGPFSQPGVYGNLHHYVFNYFAPYVQDDWKVSNRLTVNLGLRWDWRNVPYEQRNDLFWFDDQNMPGGSRFTGGGLCFANQALLTDGIAPAGNGVYDYCGRRNPADSSKMPFAPRVGFAFRPFNNDKTVIRGGYGIFWDSSEAREIDNSGDLYPYVERAAIAPTSQSAAIAPKLTDQLFVPQTAVVPITPAFFKSQFVAVIISDKPRNPYVQQYTLSIQHEVARNTTVEVNYVGNRGLHLLDRINANFPSQLTGTQLTTCQADFAARNPNIPATQAQYVADGCPNTARNPLQNFGPTSLNSSWTGYSNYNAGNVKLEHRSGDLSLLAIYTYSKSLDDKSAAAGVGSAGGGFAGHEDDLNPGLDYGPSDFSVKHRFVNSVVYALPIGRGKHFMGSMNRAEDMAIGGWRLGVITTFQQGFPFSVAAGDPGAYGTFNMRANITGAPHQLNNIAQWFNTTAFSQPAFGVFGNTGRNIFIGPGINNWDANLAKTFQFTERAGLEFRIETFNTFNHTQYGSDPNTTVGGQASVSNNITSPTYGHVTAARPGRVAQLGAKIFF
jgi:hypothetical protein